LLISKFLFETGKKIVDQQLPRNIIFQTTALNCAAILLLD